MNFKVLASGVVFGVMLSGLASCVGDPEELTTMTINVCNMVIPDDTSEPIYIDNDCNYNLKIDGVKNKLTINTSDLVLKQNGSKVSFTTDEMPVSSLSAQGMYSGTFVRGNANMSNGDHLSEMNGFYTSMVYYYDVIGEPFMFVVATPMLVMNYHTGDATVKTFSKNPFFKGVTTTTINGTPGTYENDEVVYRINFSDDMKSANIVLYNARFSQQMPRPLQAVVLKDVPVNLTRDGYSISVSNVIPEVLEAGELTPYPNFTFNSFDLKTISSDLTKIECEYTVAGRFKGAFTGAYCNYFVF